MLEDTSFMLNSTRKRSSLCCFFIYYLLSKYNEKEVYEEFPKKNVKVIRDFARNNLNKSSYHLYSSQVV